MNNFSVIIIGCLMCLVTLVLGSKYIEYKTSTHITLPECYNNKEHPKDFAPCGDWEDGI